jgi:pimeloyl-ACP methyl ester carboxylesterase
MSIEIKEHSFNTGVVTLNYAEGPASGPPLVLLHGGSARWQAFETIIPDLAADWHLYAPDFRGHGQSGRVAGGYRLQDYADDTIAFLRQQVSEPACIVGHSLGGMVALLVAAQCPECVQAVVVGDSPLTAETWLAVLNDGRDSLIFWRDLAGGAYSMEEIAEALKDAPLRVPDHDQPVRMRDVVGEDDPVFKWLAQNLYQHDPDMLTMLIDEPEIAAAGYDMAVVLPSIRCPVLLLQADPQAGGLLTDAEIERALPLLAQPTHVRLEGVSHVLHNEQKKPVLRAITDFLRTLFI